MGSVRIGAAELESAAMRIGGVRSVGAVRQRHGSPLPAVLVATDLPRWELVRALAAELGARWTPERLVVLNDLPVNANGKVDRSRLRALAAELSAANGNTMSPQR
ncbi:acyl-coenzyme A synthetase/AMP-(fatty) acid ligase [Streptomyces luteogriseus]|uniref:hypothetical protein n=1 Tax=Streptomyces luteogriseus TaxID=68233 RepID=UPI002783C187|nr:hypothetical protein [Streptomyces luteogriseus]MDQ0718726.1 acyl-coenzyme A synthetase/AMP-(fatty) acid ligase [Streptomyces luteogriseus]